jgi:conjugative relaxase-like TrwC/TraI family protein
VQYLRRIVAEQAPEAGASARVAWLVGDRPEGGAWRVHRDEVARFQGARQCPKAVPAFDLALRAPKSVSLLYALGHLVEPERLTELGIRAPDGSLGSAVLRCHQAAVADALRLLERHGCWVRGPGGRLPGRGLVAACFDHVASRAGDPLLHTHLVIANVTEGAVGRRRTLDSTALYAWTRTAGHVYQAALRWHLASRLGVAWTEPHQGVADLVGVPRELIEAFSVRRREILAELARSGGTDGLAAQAATLTTRRPKSDVGEHGHPPEVLAAKAAAFGFGIEDLVGVLGPPRDPSASPEEISELGRRLASPEGLCAHASTVDWRDALCGLAGGLRDGCLLDDLEAMAGDLLTDPARFVPLAGHGSMVRRRDGRRVRAGGVGGGYTTPWLVDAECSLLEVHAHALAYRKVHDCSGSLPDAVLDRFPTLRPDQAMVAASLAAASGIEIVVGSPGSGKTYALAAAAACWHDQGRRVLGCALQGGAAQVLAAEAGLDDKLTLTGLLLRVRREGPLAALGGSVVVVDEAGMADTVQLCQVALACRQADALLVLVGDPDQIPEVGPGGGFAALVRQAGDRALRLEGNHRQASPADRHRAELLREGRAADALESARADGLLTIEADADRLRLALLDDWAADPGMPGRDKLILAPTIAEVEQLSAMARARWADLGRLTGPELPIDLHDAARPLDRRTFQAGDRVRAQRNLHPAGVHTGMVGTVLTVDAVATTVTVGFDVHPAADGTPAPPHVVLLDRRFLEERFVPTAHGGRTDPAGLTWAYASSANASQGRTCDTTYLLAATAGGHRQAAYVMATRARQMTRWYAMTVPDPAELVDHQWHGHTPPPDPSDTKTLADRLRLDGAKCLAIDHDADVDSMVCLLRRTPADLWAERNRMSANQELPQHPSLQVHLLKQQVTARLRLPLSRLDVPAFDQAARVALRTTGLDLQPLTDHLCRRGDKADRNLRGAHNPVAVLIGALRDLPAAPDPPAAAPDIRLLDLAIDRQRTQRLVAAEHDPTDPAIAVLGPAPHDHPTALAHWRRARMAAMDERTIRGIHDDRPLLARDPLERLLGPEPPVALVRRLHHARTQIVLAILADHSPPHPRLGAPVPEQALAELHREFADARSRLASIERDRADAGAHLRSPAGVAPEGADNVRLHAPGRRHRLHHRIDVLADQIRARAAWVHRQAVVHPPGWAAAIIDSHPIDAPPPDPAVYAGIVGDLAIATDSAGQQAPSTAQLRGAMAAAQGLAPTPEAPPITA